MLEDDTRELDALTLEPQSPERDRRAVDTTVRGARTYQPFSRASIVSVS
jgi:hypothetical protein